MGPHHLSDSGCVINVECCWIFANSPNQHQICIYIVHNDDDTSEQIMRSTIWYSSGIWYRTSNIFDITTFGLAHRSMIGMKCGRANKCFVRSKILSVISRDFFGSQKNILDLCFFSSVLWYILPHPPSSIDLSGHSFSLFLPLSVLCHFILAHRVRKREHCSNKNSSFMQVKDCQTVYARTVQFKSIRHFNPNVH